MMRQRDRNLETFFDEINCDVLPDAINKLTDDFCSLRKGDLARLLAKAFFVSAVGAIETVHVEKDAITRGQLVALLQNWGDISRGKKFKTHRPKGSFSEKREYINALVASNPNKTTKELLKLADRNIIGEMKDGTFGNHVTKARAPKL